MDIQTEEASRQVSEMHRKIVKATNEVKSLKANKKQLQRFNLKAQDQVHRSKVQLLEAQSRIQELEGLLGNGGTCVVCQCLQPARCAPSPTLAQSKFTKVEHKRQRIETVDLNSKIEFDRYDSCHSCVVIAVGLET
ncbi:hypothetical protein THAOC_07550 [Thalassiosira oceanica]|uniref:Uncharacterized protein n=1 Tax=Thalassiosira oceanica TaxID=159749 RepID=K0T1I7_THAOC|nr:hypothetical protein THAOC_07550 [Thalassiosira oceanica]|eukprot:EJK71044.1 hypothetical protein THAOC_07550 [Thalassiosira oceanica]